MRLSRTTIAIFSVIFIIEAIFICFRISWKGAPYYQVVRKHALVNMELFMFIGSYFIWTRITESLSVINDGTVIQTRFRWRTICFQDVTKATLVLFLALAQISYIFYYIYLGSEPNFMAVCSLTALAAYLHVLIFLLLAQLVHGLSMVGLKFNIFPSFSKYIFDSKHAYTLMATVCAFMLVVGGLYTTFRDPVYRHVNIPIRNIRSSNDTLKVALLSDIHIGPTVGKRRMNTIVKLTNKLNPDIIAISGDLADGFLENLEGAAEPLRDLKAKYGVYFATGNHEYMHGNIEEWFEFLRKANVNILHNSNKRFEHGKTSVCVAGMDDLYAARAHFVGHSMNITTALEGCKQDDLVIVLAHQPNAAKILLKDEKGQLVDLILSGHTHGGQMYMFMPIVYIANAFTRGLYYYENTGSFVYVSAGVNFFGPPIKMFGACEIIDINLHSLQ